MTQRQLEPIQHMPVLGAWDVVLVAALFGGISIVWLVAEWWTVAMAMGE